MLAATAARRAEIAAQRRLAASCPSSSATIRCRAAGAAE